MLLGLLVTTGVLIMHTVGHRDGAHDDVPTPAAHSMLATHGDTAWTAHSGAGTHTAAAHLAAVAGALISPAVGGTMNPMLMCLAVLFATVIIVITLTRLARTADIDAGTAGRLRTAYRQGRGPPGPPSHGLILADLAVMRN